MNIMNIESVKKLEAFKKRFALINGCLEDNLAKKYIALYTSLLRASEMRLVDLVQNRASKIRFVGYTKADIKGGNLRIRVMVKENDYLRRKSSSPQLECFPELDICSNLLDLTLPHSVAKVKTVGLLEGTLKPLECITVYADAINTKSAFCVPSISIVDVLSQIPEEKLDKVSAFAMWLERDFPTSSFNVLLNKFTFKVMLYSGELPDEVCGAPVVYSE